MEDSDDTVAPDLDKEELEYHGDVSEASLPCSPSILQTNNMASAPVRLHVFNCSTALSIDTGNYKNRDDTEIVPCSSDETSGATEEELSQEYLPPTCFKPSEVEAQSCELVASASTTSNNLTSDRKEAILDQISADQDSIVSELDKINVNYGNIIPPNLSKDTNGKLSELQKKLKRVSESHQEERKRLVVTYTSLSQDQGMAGREGKSLQSQLISLSVRHKKLLQLFSIQKEIGSKLEKLEKREASAKKTVELSMRNMTSPVIIPNLARHLVQPQSHLQDSRFMPTNITATLLPERNVPISSSEAATTNTNPSPQTQASSQTRATRSPEIEPAGNSRNKRPALSNPNPLSSHYSQVTRPSTVKQMNSSSNKQQASLLSLKKSVPLSVAQVHALLQTSQTQASNRSLDKHLPISIALPTQPHPVSVSQLNPLEVQSSRKIRKVSSQARDIKSSANDNSLKTQPVSSSILSPNQSQPKQSSSAIIEGSLKTQPLSSSTVPPNQSQPKPLCFLQQVDTTIARNKPASSSELTQPVPLEVLIQHKILEPKSCSLTCTIMGCTFISSLLEDGSIQEVPLTGKGSPNPPGQTACHYRQPQLWVKACWGHLGHANKNVTKKQAYNVITYLEKTLSHYCEQYSLKQVSTFLTQKKQHRAQRVNTRHQEAQPQAPPNISNEPKEFETNFSQLPMESRKIPSSATPLPPPAISATANTSTEFNLDVLLLTGQVLLVSGRNKSLKLPNGFWKEEDLTRFMPLIHCQIENNFDW